jgi:hypothetical protein
MAFLRDSVSILYGRHPYQLCGRCSLFLTLRYQFQVSKAGLLPFWVVLPSAGRRLIQDDILP